MRSYFQLFFSLILPLSALFIVASIVYFSLQYDINKAIRLGVLVGSLLGTPVALVLALFLHIKRSVESSKLPVQRKKPKKKKQPFIQNNIEPLSPLVDTPIQETTETIVDVLPKDIPIEHASNSIELINQKIMLLMDKELALEVLFHAIHEKNIGTLTEDNSTEGALRIKIKEDIIEIFISTLTRHTCQLTVTSPINSPEANDILVYMKDKEYSFLQY